MFGEMFTKCYDIGYIEIVSNRKKLWLFHLMFFSSIAETPRHGDIVADTENVLWTIFFYINENSLKNSLHLLEIVG